MAQRVTLTERILDAVQHAPDCPLDALVEQCPGFTWNQIYLEVDRMSRAGQLQLMHKGFGIYVVVPPRETGYEGVTPETRTADLEKLDSEARQAS